MCGISGIYKFDNSRVSKKILLDMTESLIHRGPDGGKVWLKNGVGLGHRLLKIQDLSDNSMQPMKYKDWVITYNGEVYNFIELRTELNGRGYKFNTSSDTEVILKSFDCWGIKCLKKFIGFFAFVIYNKKSNDLYLIRDRFGIKPLYYIKIDNELLFASEIKSILKNPNLKLKFNYDALAIAMACNLWMSPNLSYFKNINLLDAGTYLKCNRDGIKKFKYYSIKNRIVKRTKEEVVSKFRFLINESVKRNLMSKVRISAFLSGGLDSSLICKMAQNNLQEKLSTYTVYYSDNSEDYLYVKKLSQKEGFDDRYVYISPMDYSIQNIDKVIFYMEEIPVDKVYVPIFLNYKSVRKDNFKIVLNGQGADEPWMGYLFTWDIFNRIGKEFSLDFLVNSFYLGEKMIFHGKLKNTFLKVAEKSLKKHLIKHLFKPMSEDRINSCSIFAIKTIMHNLLLQEDKLGMANSIESRVPFVNDHSIIELSLETLGTMKIKDGKEKFIVRMAAANTLPDYIINRPKTPFPEPTGDAYTLQVYNICCNNWSLINQSKILRRIIKKEYLTESNNFSSKELWWILNIWRFEEVFNFLQK